MKSPSSVDLSDENVLGTLWAQLLVQFPTDCFETFHIFSAWNGSRCACGLDLIH